MNLFWWIKIWIAVVLIIFIYSIVIIVNLPIEGVKILLNELKNKKMLARQVVKQRGR